MAQTLLIGLGGTGSRVVNNVVRELHLNNREINDGNICCAVMDSNANDNEELVGSNTGVPVIPTSKAQKIRDYFADYHHLHMETWCPSSPTFLEESMIDGCSELRMKSRVAFMDCLESGVIDRLERLINDVLRNNSGSKIRIMLVSSLSGGTGAGMFIQVALWLRQFLSQSQITIRGIFLLPDVFVSTVKDIRDNKTTTVRHYCNAYAAIRELNAISKIMKSNSAEISGRIAIDGLFDSQVDRDSGKPIFDFAFFVDDKDQNGVPLESIAEYERTVAQLVYMQLYAPMKDDMYSEEDNAFLSFVENDEPLYGACGTAKAVYPVESVKTYCAVRAAKDSLTTGWRKIDAEIEALVEERKQAQKDGIFTGDEIDVRKQFIKLFDEKISVPVDQVGSDRFFLTISRDTKNEERKTSDGKIHISYTDKVGDFLKLLKLQRIETLVNKHSGTDDYAIDKESFVADDHKKGDLLQKIKDDAAGLEEALDTFDAKVEEYADSIVGAVFPYSMGEVKPSNRCTIYGLLTKQDEKGDFSFIHPVAARYVLYKLVEELENGIKGIVLTDSRSEALSGGDVGTQFDNKSTAETETDPTAFLESKRWYQGESAFLDDFEGRYAEFIATKIALCQKYQKERLQVSVYKKLLERLNLLIQQLEAFFRNLDDVQTKLDETLGENIQETRGVVGKTLFVFGSPENKEAIYQSLDFELDTSNVKINKGVIDAIYGRLCAEKRPSIPENAQYANVGVVAAFLQQTLAAFRDKIDGNTNNSEIVNMDIYTALCKESDVEFESREKKGKTPGVLDDLDVTTGAVRANNLAAQRHRSAFIACRDRLFRMAAPLLIYSKELSSDDMGTRTTREKAFWGFSPAVSAACPYMGTELGVNADLQADDAYGANELCCYRAVYGLEATYIPKFNELSGGAYYTSYAKVIDAMVRDAEGRQGERAYVRTPHLDKTWHTILPYITEEKRKQDEMEFFHGFWLAIAYGLIRTDKDGAIQLRRAVDGGFGNSVEVDVPVLYKNKPIAKTDVLRLIDLLRADKVFTGTDLPRLEARFREELEEMINYADTDVLKGLTPKKDDLHPIDLIARYNETPRHNVRVSASLIGALEMIAGELAANYNAERSEAQLAEAKYSLCRRIYDSSKRTKGRSEIFQSWETAFKKYKV